jgi:DNA-binding XRE family transcriptional regulator
LAGTPLRGPASVKFVAEIGPSVVVISQRVIPCASAPSRPDATARMYCGSVPIKDRQHARPKAARPALPGRHLRAGLPLIYLFLSGEGCLTLTCIVGRRERPNWRGRRHHTAMKKRDLDALYREFGDLVRACRQQRPHPLSQERLGHLVGLSRTSIVNIEKGRHHLVVHQLLEFARALKVRPEALLPPIRPTLRHHGARKNSDGRA